MFLLGVKGFYCIESEPLISAIDEIKICQSLKVLRIKPLQKSLESTWSHEELKDRKAKKIDRNFAAQQGKLLVFYELHVCLKD